MDTPDWPLSQGHRLLQLGMLLFLFALLVGLAVPKFYSATSRPGNPRTWDHERHLSHGPRTTLAEAAAYACDLADRFLPGGLWLPGGVDGEFVGGNLGSGKLRAADRGGTSSWELASGGNDRDCFGEWRGV